MRNLATNIIKYLFEYQSTLGGGGVYTAHTSARYRCHIFDMCGMYAKAKASAIRYRIFHHIHKCSGAPGVRPVFFGWKWIFFCFHVCVQESEHNRTKIKFKDWLRTQIALIFMEMNKNDSGHYRISYCSIFGPAHVRWCIFHWKGKF